MTSSWLSRTFEVVSNSKQHKYDECWYLLLSLEAEPPLCRDAASCWAAPESPGNPWSPPTPDLLYPANPLTFRLKTKTQWQHKRKVSDHRPLNWAIQTLQTSPSPASFCRLYPCYHFSLFCLPSPPSSSLSSSCPPPQEVCCGRRWCSPVPAGVCPCLRREFLLMSPAHSTWCDTVRLWG